MMRDDLKTFIKLIVTATCLCGIATLPGCLAENQAESEHAGHHEDDHDHHIPEHKPEHFVEAVEQLEARTSQFDPAQEANRLELLDIIGWLPELAAQTDLPKEDWDKIQAISQQWQSGDWQQAPQKSFPEFDQQLDELKQLAQKAIDVDQFNSYRTKESEDV